MRSALFVTVLAFAIGCGSQQEASTARSEPESSEPVTADPGPSDEREATDPEPASETPRIVVGTDPCTTDADCVPDGCCHPAACVAASQRPGCGDMVCTTECRYGTLDCGGACLCQDGHCAARLSTPPVIPGVGDVH